MKTDRPDELLGVGIYTVPEAARLTGMNGRKIHRWLGGYTGRDRRYHPVWQSQIESDDALYLGFADLIELRAAQTFLDEGVAASTIRKAIAAARAIVDVERPLSDARLRTDGCAIFLEIACEEEDNKLIELTRGQHVFASIVEQSLKNVEFVDDRPILWWPGSRRSGVVLDPARSFGQPIETETSIPTYILANAARTEGGVAEAARALGVSRRAVERSVSFEERFKSTA